MKIRFAPAAVRDLRALRTYIGHDDPDAARRIAERIEKAVRLIAAKPGIGRPIGGGDIRQWPIPGLPYLIPYRVVGDTLEVLRVYHMKRDKPEDWLR